MATQIDESGTANMSSFARFLLLFCIAAHFVIPSSSAQQARLLFGAPIRNNVSRLPQVAGISKDASIRINRAIDQENRDLRGRLIECDKDFTEYSNEVLEKPRKQYGSWERKIRVTMSGPRFLSLVTEDSFFCGGVHPDFSQTALLYDLSTGEQVQFIHIKQDELVAWYINHLRDNDCQTSLAKENMFFMIYLDATSHRVAIAANNLPHVIQACAEEISLPADVSRRLGFPAEVLSALAQATRGK